MRTESKRYNKKEMELSREGRALVTVKSEGRRGWSREGKVRADAAGRLF